MDPAAWIALNSVKGVGKVLYKRLVLRFGSPESVFRAPGAELARMEGAKPPAVKAIKEFADWEAAADEAARAAAAGAEIIAFTDPRYPANLRETHDPPPYLYVKGSLIPEDRVAVAIVGSRAATPFGRQITRRIGGELAAKGITVVSGGARGIDTEAHRGALDVKGRTVAVLGCGIDIIYPPENGELYSKIAESGAVITEYPLGTPPEASNFPPRNRIISGMSLGVVVMEATDDSGSLITASYSIEQGREVYAMPGSIGSPTSRGTNNLIKKGAKLVQGSQDIMLDLFPYLKGYLRELALEENSGAAKAGADGKDGPGSAGEVIMPRPPEQVFGLGPEEKALFECISVEPVHVDVLARKSGVAVPRALSLLLGMELKGAVRQVSGMRYVREA